MKFKNIPIIIYFIVSLFTVLEANSNNVETTLEDLLLCNETWGSIFKRDLAHGSTMNDPRNIHSIYLSDFNRENIFYTPNKDIKIFEGKIISFSTTAGMSPGVSALIDLDFEKAKKIFEDNKKIIFDECKQTKYDKSCTKKVSPSKSFIIFETKNGIAIACAYPYVR